MYHSPYRFSFLRLSAHVSDPTQRLIIDLRKEIAALKLQLESGGVAPAAAPPPPAPAAAPAGGGAEGAAAASSPPPAPAASAAATAPVDGDSTAAAAAASAPPAPTAAPEGGAAPAPAAAAPAEETVVVEVVPDEVKKAFKSKQDRARATAALEAVSKDPIKAAALQKSLEESTDGTAQIEPAPGDGGEDEKGKKKKGGGGEPITVNKSCVNITKTAAAAPGLGPERIVIQKEVRS